MVFTSLMTLGELGYSEIGNDFFVIKNLGEFRMDYVTNVRVYDLKLKKYLQKAYKIVYKQNFHKNKDKLYW